MTLTLSNAVCRVLSLAAPSLCGEPKDGIFPAALDCAAWMTPTNLMRVLGQVTMQTRLPAALFSQQQLLLLLLQQQQQRQQQLSDETDSWPRTSLSLLFTVQPALMRQSLSGGASLPPPCRQKQLARRCCSSRWQGQALEGTASRSQRLPTWYCSS
jgi:hypothetical protein